VRILAQDAALTALLCVALAGCVIHHVRPYSPDMASAPPSADAAAASTNCFEASTQAERVVCGAQDLAALNRTLVETWQSKLRPADFAGRDVLLAAQRRFLLALPQTCHLPDAAAPNPAPSAQQAACLAAAFRRQTAALAAWQGPPVHGTAIAQYVHFKIAAGAGSLNPDLCRTLAGDANGALAHAGSVDPAFMPGAQEIAGTHGPETGALAGQNVHVQIGFANAFGGFAQRARGVTIGGASVLDSVSLGSLLQSMAENQGGRFSAYASQTGDYGSADVFSYHGRIVALLADTWGYDTPAAPGGFAHAGAWDIGVRPPAPLCLFETFQMPAERDLEALPSLAAWQATLQQMRESAAPDLGVGFLRDQAQVRAEIIWTLLHTPLVATEQARTGGWTNWLRLRHDIVLDTLFTWSEAAPAHKALFDQAFALQHPAAQDIVSFYQQTQALSGPEAQEAAGLAVMELLYGATVTIAPGLGAGLQAPGDAAGRKPRYPILASPQ